MFKSSVRRALQPAKPFHRFHFRQIRNGDASDHMHFGFVLLSNQSQFLGIFNFWMVQYLHKFPIHSSRLHQPIYFSLSHQSSTPSSRPSDLPRSDWPNQKKGIASVPTCPPEEKATLSSANADPLYLRFGETWRRSLCLWRIQKAYCISVRHTMWIVGWASAFFEPFICNTQRTASSDLSIDGFQRMRPAIRWFASCSSCCLRILPVLRSPGSDVIGHFPTAQTFDALASLSCSVSWYLVRNHMFISICRFDSGSRGVEGGDYVITIRKIRVET
jgi:hypothetical protein